METTVTKEKGEKFWTNSILDTLLKEMIKRKLKRRNKMNIQMNIGSKICVIIRVSDFSSFFFLGTREFSTENSREFSRTREKFKIVGSLLKIQNKTCVVEFIM